MIRSMTGYGRGQEIVDGREITVELRAVNHRYFELSSRVPRIYGYLEEKIKSYLQSRIGRGKVDVNVTVLNIDTGSAEVQLNRPLAQSYLAAIREMGEALGLDDDITLSGMTRFSDLFVVRKVADDEDSVWAGVRAVLDAALTGFTAMRQTEGERLEADILSRAETIGQLVGIVEESSPKTVAQYREKLFQKLQEVLGQSGIDEQRMLTEAAVFAERVAVDEETVRLRSHLLQLKEIVAGGDAVGRKLDFLVQEINREANTIGSKAMDADIAKVVVNIKAEIEKIREQIQNIE